MTFDVKTFDIKEFDRILSCGLSHGLGKRGRQVCIEAAICQVLGLDHDDDPGCVAESVRRYKIRLNDSPWSSPAARAAGLRDLGLAQLGSKGVVDDQQFATRMAEKTIRVLIPTLFRDLFPDDEKLLAVALRCEQEGTKEAAAYAYAAASAAYAAASAASAASDAAYAASAAYASDAASAASDAAYAYAAASAASAASSAASAAYAAYAASAAYADKYLNLSAKLALETLRELNSPGVSLLS
jgi:hypothetical protein